MRALYSNTTANYNTASGNYSLYTNTTGSNNTATGYKALITNTTGARLTASGMYSLKVNTTGAYSTATGYGALCLNTTGQHNTASGYKAGANNTTGNQNTFIGSNACASSATITNTLAIGYNARTTASNTTVIGNANTTNTTIFGTVSAPDATFGAVMESGLADSQISDYEEGTVLVWESGHLIPCYKEYDNKVMGISKKDYETPIVLGAEPVLITGIIGEGDFIVTSEKSGHGKKGVSNNLFGKVIAQALEDGDGDSYTIKAMIRKI